MSILKSANETLPFRLTVSSRRASASCLACRPNYFPTSIPLPNLICKVSTVAYSVKPLPSVSALRKGAGCRKTAHVLIPVPMWESGSKLMASEWPAPAAAGTGGTWAPPRNSTNLYKQNQSCVSPKYCCWDFRTVCLSRFRWRKSTWLKRVYKILKDSLKNDG